MTLKERVLDYCEAKGMSISAFERAAGLSNGFFKESTRNPRADKRKQISEAFPDLNISWLLTGEGEMLKSETVEPNQNAEDMQVKKWMELLAEALDQNSRLIGQIERMQGMIERMQGIDQSAIGTRKSPPPLVFRPETE